MTSPPNSFINATGGAVIVGALTMPAVSTLGDLIWATCIARPRMVYGLTHGTLLFLCMGLYLGLVARKPWRGAAAGGLIGFAAAGSFYLLGYEPAHGEDRQYHRITVHVKRPGLRIIHRQGYLDLPADERLEQLLRLRISFLQPASELPVTMNLSDMKQTDGKPAVAALAAMPMTRITLLPKDGRYVGRVHVYLAIFDGNGNNVGFHHKVQDLSMTSAEHERAVSDAFRYRMNIRLDRGDFTVAMTMRDDMSNEIGTAVQKVRF